MEIERNNSADVMAYKDDIAVPVRKKGTLVETKSR